MKIGRKLPMNYIKEMNAFYTQLQTNPLSSSAIALWGTLMNINNSTGWKKEFTVAASLLRTIAGLSEGAFKRARIELQEKGYIVWRSRGGNQAAIYEMVSLSALVDYTSTTEVQDTTKLEKNKNQVVQEPSTTTETDSISTPPASVLFFQENFGGELSPFITTELNTWITKQGDALVLEAMKRAVRRNKTSWGYVKSILQAWKQKGIQTVDEAREEINRGSGTKKQNRSKTFQQKNTEVIPEWFKKRTVMQATVLAKPTDKKEDVVALLENFKRQKIGLI